MTNKEILIEARKLISSPERWCKGVYAMNDNYQSIDALDEKAIRWCSVGACYKITRNLDILFDKGCRGGIIGILSTVARQEITCYNDEDITSHSNILEVFDKAIALAGEKANDND